MKIISMNEQEFDKYAQNHMYKNYYQTSSYGRVMQQEGFKVIYIGITDDLNMLIGAALIIYKDIFMNKKIAYAPRGILFDYNNKNLTEELVITLKQFLSKQNIILLKMDPYIPATIRNKKGKTTNMNKNINNIMLNLKEAGFSYKGQNKFFENELSRYESIVLLKNRTIKDIYINFSKRTKHKINKAANSGIKIITDEKKDINILDNFCKNNNIQKYNNYYKYIINNFSQKANLYYAVLDTNVFVSVSKNIYEKEMDKNDILSKKIQNLQISNSKKQKLLNRKIESDKLLNTYKDQLIKATELLEQNPKSIILGAAITLEYDNSIYLFDDFYTAKFNNLNANYLIRWYIINDAKNKNYKFVNMNAMTGEFIKQNPYSNLNENKLGFGCIPTEYIGEFELIIDNFNYKLYQSFSKDKNYKFKSDIK